MRPRPAANGPRLSSSNSRWSPSVGMATLLRDEARANERHEPEQAVGGKQHDGEEDAADHEVEALAKAGDQVDGEVLRQHEDDRADEGADRMLHAAEHGDDEDV